MAAKQNQDAFNLYKSQRDADDDIRKECEIDKAFTAGINYTDRKTCKAIYGQVTLPNTPTVTGYVGANACGCPQVVTA